MTTPEQVPEQLVAGDTWTWARDLGDYPASAYTVSWYFENDKAVFSAAGSGSGTTHTATIAAGTTAAYTPGRYRWRLLATATVGGARTSLEAGWVEVLPDPAAAGKVDHRTHARRVLDAIEKVIEGTASRDEKVFALGNRSTEFVPRAELMAMRDKYRREVAAEVAAERIAQGKPAGRRILTRLV